VDAVAGSAIATAIALHGLLRQEGKIITMKHELHGEMKSHPPTSSDSGGNLLPWPGKRYKVCLRKRVMLHRR